MIDLDAIRANATDSKRRIGEMCANLRPPKMSIPVSPNDDDEFICRTMDDLLAYVDELLAERALIVQRAENAEAALVESDALLREMLAWKVAIECIAPELGGAIMTLARIDAHLAREEKP
jgi:hypothetical protein